MQPDYTFALKINETLPQLRQRLSQRLAYNGTSNCLLYVPKQAERLLKLADDLTTLAAKTPQFKLENSQEQVVAQLTLSNLGHVPKLSAANRGPYRVHTCATAWRNF